MRTTRPWLQLGRSALLFGSTVLNFIALRYLQLDQTIAIIFSHAVHRGGARRPDARRMDQLAALDRDHRRLSRRAAGDAPGRRRHPSGRAPRSLGAFCYAIYSISTRILSRTTATETTLFYSNLVGAIVATMIGAVRLDAAEPLARHRC